MSITANDVIQAYQLILGCPPGPGESADEIAAEVTTLQQLRTRLLLHPHARRSSEILNAMGLFYRGSEADEKSHDRRMKAFLDSDYGDELIRAALDQHTDDYTKFHRARFYDQLRALSAMRGHSGDDAAAFNVLDIGVMAVSAMYGDVVSGVRLHTCDHPRHVERNARHGSQDFYPVDLEAEVIGQKFPDARGKFHAIMFCEVLEHLKVAPKEILADLKQLLASGGMIYLTTPNGMSYTTFLAYFKGRSPVARYSRQNRVRHDEGFLHVREHTMKEMIAAIDQAGLRIAQRAIREYFHPDTLWASAYVSGRTSLTMVLEAA